jgi:hypothetical protein
MMGDFVTKELNTNIRNPEWQSKHKHNPPHSALKRLREISHPKPPR